MYSVYIYKYTQVYLIITIVLQQKIVLKLIHIIMHSTVYKLLGFEFQDVANLCSSIRVKWFLKTYEYLGFFSAILSLSSTTSSQSMSNFLACSHGKQSRPK